MVQTFSQYSKEAQAYAYAQAQRKAQGKRITFAGEPEEYKGAYASLLNENGDISRAVEQGSQARATALSRGFSSVQEAQAVSGLAKKNTIKPNSNQLVITSRTEEAQQLSPINVIDTNKGSITTRTNTQNNKIEIIKIDSPNLSQTEAKEIVESRAEKGQVVEIKEKVIQKDNINKPTSFEDKPNTETLYYNEDKKTYIVRSVNQEGQVSERIASYEEVKPYLSTLEQSNSPEGLRGVSYNLRAKASELGTSEIRDGGIDYSSRLKQTGIYFLARGVDLGADLKDITSKIISYKIGKYPINFNTNYSQILDNLKDSGNRIKESIQGYGVILSTQPQRAVGELGFDVASTLALSQRNKLLVQVEKLAGLPRYSTILKGTEVLKIEDTSISVARGVTLREGLFSNRRFAFAVGSQARDLGEISEGLKVFQIGSYAKSQELVIDILKARAKFTGKVISSGSISQGVIANYPGIDKGFIFRGSTINYGKTKSFSAFGGLGLESDTRVISFSKNFDVINNKLTKVGRGYTISDIKKQQEILDDIGSSSTILKQKPSKLKSLEEIQIKSNIESSIETKITAESSKLDKSLKITSIINEVLNVLPSVSAYAGKGQYEKTEFVSSPILANNLSLQPNISTIDRLSSINLNKIDLLPRDRVSINSKSKNLASQTEDTKQITKNIQKPVLNIRNIQKQGLGLKNLQRLNTKIVSTPKTTTNPFVKIKSGIGGIPLDDKSVSGTKGKELVTGFRTFIKVRGKKQYLPGVFDIDLALKRGSRRVRSDVSATFGITPTNKNVKSSGTKFRPSRDIFRDYRINKGQKIQLSNTFIQRRGKRLSSKSEVLDIQRFRKKLKGGIF